MKIKTCAATIKAAGVHDGTDDGQFQALVATYDLDSVGDRIIPGAFKDTLAAWASSGDPIPVYWSHRMDDPSMNIGQVLEATETDKGLQVKAQLDLDNPTAVQVYKLLKGRRVTQFSFAYDVEDGAFVEEKDAAPYYELRRLKLYEVGPTPIGANQATELLEVKGTGGRSLTIEVHNGTREDAKAVADTLRKGLADEDTAEGEDTERDEAAGSGDDTDTDAPDEAAAEGETSGGKTTDSPSVKEGRRNSATDADAIQSIHDAASALGAACSTKDEGKATPDLSATTEEPDGAKADEPAGKGTASNRLRTELDLLECEVSLYT